MKNKWLGIFIPLLFFTLSLLPSNGAGARPLPFSSYSLAASDLIDAVNTLRESNGLDPYKVDPILTNIAQAHAEYIAGTGVLTHFDASGKRPYQRALDAGYNVAGNLSTGGLFAEAIYSGTDVSFEDVVAAWQRNTNDENVMLSPEYQDAGVGIVAANGVTYFVLNAGAESLSTTGTPSLPLTPALTGTGSVPVDLSTPDENGDLYHIVKKDEALWSIALAYNTTIAELQRLNGLASDSIFEGQRLLIRRAATATPTETTAPVTATFGIPTSTATRPVPPTETLTPTPMPTAPATLQGGGVAVGVIILVALLAAGVGAFLGRKREKASD